MIPIFVIEPEHWQLPDHSSRQWEFVRECLVDLNNSLNDIGLKLIIRVGNIQDLIREFMKKFHVKKSLAMKRQVTNGHLNVIKI